jgi:tetratricopeptide (TPR) repeat protein
MAKKIKHRTKSREEREAEKKAADEERERQAAGIQDDFQARGFELAEWAQENQGLVLGLIGAILISGAALWGWSVMQRSTNSGASVIYAEGLEAFNAPIGEPLPGDDADGPRFDSASDRATAARKKFRQVTTDFDGSGPAQLAHLYAGHASMQLGEADEATTHYSGFLTNTEKSDPLYVLGLEGRAAAREAKGDADGAMTDLEAITNLSSKAGKDAAYLKLARMHHSKGNKDKAKGFLDRFDSDFPESPMKATATELRNEIAPGTGSPATAATPGMPPIGLPPPATK